VIVSGQSEGVRHIKNIVRAMRRPASPHKKPAPTDAGKEVITGYPKGDGALIERQRQLGGGRTVE
jgi:hypothetical protein